MSKKTLKYLQSQMALTSGELEGLLIHTATPQQDSWLLPANFANSQ